MARNDIRILLLAPNAKELMELRWVADEIDAVVNFKLNLRVERDGVTEKRLVELIASDPCDMIWFASHGTSEGIYLSDGLISSESLAAILRGSGIQYVVLNTCDSVKVAATISEETHADVICTVSSISDRDAWRTGALFARELAKGATVRNAYKIARPTKPGQYIYLPGFNGTSNKDDVKAKITELSAAIGTGEIGRIEAALAELQSLPGRVQRLEDRMAAVEVRVYPPISSIIALVAAFLVLVGNVVAGWTIITSSELSSIFSMQPLLVWGGEVVLVMLMVSWTWYAVAQWRAKGKSYDRT